ncbi:MAG: hypothetical protein GF353_13200 [Candidatus Lokiarchaeota archaeon]|nr:hypothetical protein [Candidatus Lokiarchaeota archaeon]
MPDDNIQFHENSDAVQAHLSISQSVIQRMSTNSASCKGWCIAIVSAILVVVADKSKPEYALIALIPIILFMALDAYYLGLEKRFRASYNNFIEKLHKRGITALDLYAIIPTGDPVKIFVKALLSFSVWPFYIMLLLMVGITWKYVL